MNVGNNSVKASSCAVRSKYFIGKSVMDESLSEFQEPKKSCAGPKTTSKKNITQKKVPKRPRGQKDIRTALRSKKNELETYAEDFDKVCKKAGIDVDSQQLQLAIALSKSLQDEASTSEDITESSRVVTTQERIGKIRNTLQEYGFRVPKIKIDGDSRKNKKLRKIYKLVNTTDVEKNEIIANRYAQVLFQNITLSNLYSLEIDTTNIPLFNLASNKSYDNLRTVDSFYVDNLVDKSTSNGNLLKNWSEIPGRPESPKLFEPMATSFSEIECSQDELNIILSGSLRSCKDIVSKKIKRQNKINDCKDIVSVENNKAKINENQLIVDAEADELIDINSTSTKYRSCSPDMFDEDASDILDDSNSVISSKKVPVQEKNSNLEYINKMDLSNAKSKCNKNNITIRESNDMELTECIIIESNDCTEPIKKMAQSQKIDVTKRKSNDFMELTECVVTLSQPLQQNIDLTQHSEIINEVEKHKKSGNSQLGKDINIDLTSSPQNNNDENEDRNTPKDSEKGQECMDLTQSSNTSDELPFVSLTSTKNKSLNGTIVLDANDFDNFHNHTNLQKEILIDLTQNVQNNEATVIQSQSFFEEYNHDHSDSTEEPKDRNVCNIYEDNHDRKDLSQNFEGLNCYADTDATQKTNSELELRNSLPQTNKANKNCSSHIVTQQLPVVVENNLLNSTTKDLCKERLTSSPNRLNDNEAKEDIDLTQNSDKTEEYQMEDIDLTQKSDSSVELSQTKVIDDITKLNNQNINMDRDCEVNDFIDVRISQTCGEKDDVSIDYDEVINSENPGHSKMLCPESIVYEYSEVSPNKFNKTNSILSNCSQKSDVFEISDKELDYSLHKSKLETTKENFALGGISIMNELSNLGTSKKSIEIETIVNEVNVDNAPTINTRPKSKEISPIKHRRVTEIATPQKACCCNEITATTPNNSELIVRTTNVTPMVNFESMSTPEIHEELDKYGIKPFKRKRAIQLLTHIYIQTHPVIETAYDLATPPKRRKLNDLPTSSRKIISPRKLISENFSETDSNAKTDIDKENNTQANKVYKGKGKGKGKKSRVSLNDMTEDITTKHTDEGSIKSTQHRTEDVLLNSAVKEVECSPEDWVFQKREKSKVHSCRVPLHIAFYNYVASRQDLRESILCYEPIEIDVIHKDLVGYGHRYDPKDLLKFLDKKCITVKTTDNDGRNNKK